MPTVNPVQSATYDLSSGANPITFGSGTNITASGSNDGVLGVSAVTWTITNQGAIAGYNGIDLQAQSTVTNAGAIIGSGHDGIKVSNGAGYITNSGYIKSTAAHGFGVGLANGGTVTNESDGYIGANNHTLGDGVGITGATGTVTNAGEIHSQYALGVAVAAGGSVTNYSSGHITAYSYGVVMQGGAGTVTNAGFISSAKPVSGVGVVIEDGAAGGTVINQSLGQIIGNTGVYSNSSTPLTLSNAGYIAGTADPGMSLFDGGSVTNYLHGRIHGTTAGIYGKNVALSVTNAGSIVATIGSGVAAWGSVTNQSGATISGANTGVFINFNMSGTVTNAGTISGGNSVFFTGPNNTLTLQSGGVLIGPAVGSTSTGAVNALVLQGTGETDNNFLHFTSLIVQSSGGAWTLGGTSSIGATTIQTGMLDVTGTLTTDLTVDAGAVVELTSASVGGITSITAQAGAVMDLLSTTVTSVSVNGSDQLVISNGASVVATINLTDADSGLRVVHRSDGAGGSDIAAESDVRANFDNHSLSDLLIRNTAGAVVVGEVSNGQVGFAQVTGLGSEWSFRGNGDFVGQGHSQFLIENTAGAVFVGEISSGQATFQQVSGLGQEWTFVGVGNFLGHGNDDFLIENTAGAVFAGEVGASGQAAYTQVTGLGPEWKFVGAGDYFGDHQDDFLIENTAGAVVVGEVGSNGQTTFTAVTGLGQEWKFVGSGDFLGDGKDDFLIENTAGAVFAGEVGAGDQVTFTQLTGLGSEWKFVGDGDYLGEGHDQFLIENTAGAVVVGDWNHGAIHFSQVSGLGPEWSFH